MFEVLVSLLTFAGPASSFQSIGKPADQYTSRIVTHDGQLFEYVSQRYYKDGQWMPMSREGRASIDNGHVVNIIKANGKTYRFTIRGKTCPGVSVFSDDGYHGSHVPADLETWNATYTDGKIVVVNADYRVWVGDLPKARPIAECRDLALQPVGAKGDWVHAYIGVPGGILYGGRTHRQDDCAPLRLLDPKQHTVKTIPIPGCKNRLITEFYSYVWWRGEVLIGNFWLGTLLAFDPKTRKVRWTRFAPIQADDRPRDGKPYRESQSMAVVNGRLLVGMLPWAEVFVHESEDKYSVHRLLDFPAKGNDYAPFSRKLNEALVRDGYGDLSVLPQNDVQRLRERTRPPDSWLQRVTSIAVVGDKVCAATGNLYGYRHDGDQHPVQAELANRYGEIFCAEVHAVR